MIPFVVFGTGSLPSFFGQQPSVEVAGHELAGFEIGYEQIRVRSQLGVEESDLEDPRIAAEVGSRALKNAVSRRLLIDLADSEGIRVSEGELEERLKMILQNEGLPLNDSSLTLFASSRGLSPGQFVDLIKGDLLADFSPKTVLQSQFPTSFTAAIAADLLASTRDLRVVELSLDGALAKSQVEEAEVVSWYEQNRENYLTKRRFAVNYLEFDTASFVAGLGDVEIPESIIQESLESPETEPSVRARRASHIMLETGQDRDLASAFDTANKLVEELRQGASFAERASEYSDDLQSKSTGGDLGFSDGSLFPEPMEAAIAELEVGEIAEPIQIGEAVHILTVTEKNAPSSLTAEEIAKRRIEQYKEELAAEKMRELVEAIVGTASGNGLDLSAAATSLELGDKVRQTVLLGEGEGEGLGADPSFQEAVLGFAEEGEGQLELVQLLDGRQILFEISKIDEPKPKPLAEVRDEITSLLARSAAEALLDERMEDVLERTKEGGLGPAAQSEGLSAARFLAVSRDSNALPEEVKEQIFAMEVGEIKPLLTFSGDRLIVEVAGASAGQMLAPDDPRGRRLTALLERAKVIEVLDSIDRDLLQKADIEGLDEALEAFQEASLSGSF